MVAKKNSKKAASDQTGKRCRAKAAKAAAAPVEAPAPAERALAEVSEPATAPASETARTVASMPAEAAVLTAVQTPADQLPKGKKLSALEAAARVLAETGQAMNCQQLIAAMASQGYWRSPKGRTPAATLYSAILRELQTQGDKARFVKAERGKFALRGTV